VAKKGPFERRDWGKKKAGLCIANSSSNERNKGLQGTGCMGKKAAANLTRYMTLYEKRQGNLSRFTRRREGRRGNWNQCVRHFDSLKEEGQTVEEEEKKVPAFRKMGLPSHLSSDLASKEAREGHARLFSHHPHYTAGEGEYTNPGEREEEKGNNNN